MDFIAKSVFILKVDSLDAESDYDGQEGKLPKRSDFARDHVSPGSVCVCSPKDSDPLLWSRFKQIDRSSSSC